MLVFAQEAFFGRDLLDTTKEKDMGSSSDSDEERASPLQVSEDKIIHLSQVSSPVSLFIYDFYNSFPMGTMRWSFLMQDSYHVLQDFRLSQNELYGLLHPELLSWLTIALFGFVGPYTS
jgi:hypothetical protein